MLNFSVNEEKSSSSAVDISEASNSGQPMNEDPIAAISQASQLSAQFSALNLGLASAFLPASDAAVTVQILSRSVSAPTVIPGQANGFEDVSRPASTAVDQLNSDSDGDELRDLFSILGLDGM